MTELTPAGVPGACCGNTVIRKGNEYPKMQMLTVEEILEGKRFAMPTVVGRHTAKTSPA